jgi:hypothetical protein
MSETPAKPSWPLLIAVCAVACVALATGLLVATPTPGPPAVALNSEVVFRIEVGAIVFVVLYGFVVAIRLAFFGKTFTKLGTTGAEIPDVSELRKSVQEYAGLERALDQINAQIVAVAENLDARVSRLEVEKRNAE